MCGPDPKMCIYTDNFCKQEVVPISFHLFERQNMRKVYTQLVGKECGIKYCVFEKHADLLVIQFYKCAISVYILLVFYILWYRF
jgi:hypothetical protein